MDEQKQQQELVTIAGGVEMEVAYQNNGDKETVKVRQIPISKIQSLVMAIGNEADLIELYCDKPKGWADTLRLESAIAIAGKGQELNLPFYERWFRIQMLWRKSQQEAIGITGTTEENKAPVASGSASASSPQVSPTTTT
jgi:hypothetical protein